LHNYPIVPMPMVPIVRTADGESVTFTIGLIMNVTDCLLKCLVYRGVGIGGPIC